MALEPATRALVQRLASALHPIVRAAEAGPSVSHAAAPVSIVVGAACLDEAAQAHAAALAILNATSENTDAP